MRMAWRRVSATASRWYHALTIGQRIAMLYVLAALFPLVVTNLYASNTLNSSAHSSQMTAAERGFEQTVGVLADRLYRIVRMCDIIALDQTLNDCLYKNDPVAYPLPRQVADMNTILTFLAQKRDDLDIYSINLYVRDEWIYSQRADMISSLSQASEQPWYGRLSDGNLQVAFCPPDMVGQKDTLSCVRPVRDLENLHRVEAILRIDFPLNEIEQILRQGSVVEGSVSMLVGSDGSVVAASERPIPVVSNWNELITGAGSPGGFFEVDENHLAQSYPIINSDWYLVTLLSRSAMTRANVFAWLGIAFLILVAALPTVLVARMVLRGMTDRIRRLGDHMRNVRLGDLTPTARDINRDEIGVMTDSYNYMIERMQALLDEQYRIGQEARSAELLALQSQINPHFLYNTLDMLRWMAKKSRTEEIQTVIHALAQFYRASLSRGKDIVTLADEVSLIDSYAIIQHMRFGDDVTLQVDVDEDVLRCTLPKITLQPIVENALLHGILPKDDKTGVIVIRGRRHGANVVIDIEDDGVGMPGERAATMLFSLRSSNSAHGYGLYNIEKRLCLTFGIARCMTVSSRPGEGTCVSMTFPARFDTDGI